MLAFAAAVCFAQAVPADAKPAPPAEGKPNEQTLAALKLRALGPAVTSGRIADLAIPAAQPTLWYVAAASGGVWKTENAGITWTPIFDDQPSYSIGCLAVDPRNPSVLWVGTGENNNQRSVGYGDGVYRTEDGGKSWKRLGLKDSQHIGRIALHPANPQVAYVAAMGPLWNAGGERGLYKTMDDGKTWNRVLNVSDDTGVTDVLVHPRQPETLLAAAHQRRRHVWTIVHGGPESGLHRSTDGGKTWRKVGGGLPGGDLGRIGLAAAPSAPNVVYAIVEAPGKAGGIFRSDDFGLTWEKRNDFNQQAQYYSELYVDPKNPERIYVMYVQNQVSDDGGRTLRPLGEKSKHVDNHALWIDPANPDHLVNGCDGGVYESFDRGQNWRHAPNLPLTQFYDIGVEQGKAFYHVFGGTQDNYTLGGPARTRNAHGAGNADWFVTQGGDGFVCKVDPHDGNLVYSESQYGGLVRFDRRTGQATGIQPQPAKGEAPYRWNWDSPFAVSAHAPGRIYFGANKLFRSDDRGQSWTALGGDLTRQLNRDALKVMGKVWGPEAIFKHFSTSIYGNLTALAESPKDERTLYVGADDGLIQATRDGGKTWRKIENVAGVPDRTYVARLLASRHAAGTVYALFDNHKNGDFKPYAAKSTDFGASWTSIAGDLPANGNTLAIAEDHVDPNLLFVGTEFGLFATMDGGKHWRRLKGGMPTIAVRDLAIQEQQHDLVVGTFGRGMFVLDDYRMLRGLKEETFRKPFHAFPTRDALLYLPATPLGSAGKGFQGETLYQAPNPAFGATFTVWIKDVPKSRQAKRTEAAAAAEKSKQTPKYPSLEELRAEQEEEAPALFATIADAGGQPVATLSAPASAGLQRLSWNLRRNPLAPAPVALGANHGMFGGYFVRPGDYTATFTLRAEGKTAVLGAAAFKVAFDAGDAEAAMALRELLDFQDQTLALRRAAQGAEAYAGLLAERLAKLKGIADNTPKLAEPRRAALRAAEARLRVALRTLKGDSFAAARQEPVPPSVASRLDEIDSALYRTLGRPPKTCLDGHRHAAEEFAGVHAELKKLGEQEVPALEAALEAADAPALPGKLPKWTAAP